MSEETGQETRDDARVEQLSEALPKLTPAQVAQVSSKLRRITFEPGETIIRQGDNPDYFYIVIRGQAEVLHEGVSGRTGTVDVRRAGEYFGETGILQNRPRNATVRASEDSEVEVLAMAREDFQAMIDDSRATEMHVAQEMIQRLISLADAQ
ncbi:MAG: cyclic nucleotide-binding domain-containing protein [Candidatus Promineifilaceae bacterium]|nr:cyclic nucleotide-binding domain-containing protein [Candidatus Promineifilaceae bacterium]